MRTTSGSKRLQRRLVEPVEVGAGGDMLAHQGIYLARRQPVGGQPADDDHVVQPSAGGLVALERHGDEVVAESEGVDDLGCRGQQRGDAHADTVSRGPTIDR